MKALNPFDCYPQTEDVVPDAPNWSRRADGSFLRRLDGVVVRRSHRTAGWEVEPPGLPNEVIRASDVGGVEASNVDALHLVDGRRPLPAPLVAVGQVWVELMDSTAEGGTFRIVGRPTNPDRLFETAVVSVVRDREKGAVVFFLTEEGVRGSLWVEPPENTVLVAGPGAPWVPPWWLPPADGETQEEEIG